MLSTLLKYSVTGLNGRISERKSVGQSLSLLQTEAVESVIEFERIGSFANLYL